MRRAKYKYLDSSGKLAHPPKDSQVHGTAKPFSKKYLRQMIQLVLSASAYNAHVEKPDFERYMNTVVDEVVGYFDGETASIEELAGYFLDEADVDLDVVLSEDDAFAIAEWIYEAFYRFQAGDYTLLYDALEELSPFSFWRGGVQICVPTKKPNPSTQEKPVPFGEQYPESRDCDGQATSDDCAEEEEEGDSESALYDYDDGIYEM